MPVQKGYSTHQIIDLIYETAIEPGNWPELLRVMAEFIERTKGVEVSHSGILDTQQPDSAMDGAVSSSGISLSSVFEQLSFSEGDPARIVVAPESDRDEINAILLKHFTKAIKIAKRLMDSEERHDAVVSLLNHLPMALFVVDEHAAVLETNHRADHMLSEQKHVLIIEGSLHARRKAYSRRLHEAIEVVHRESLLRTHSGRALMFSDEAGTEDDLMIFVTGIAGGEFQQTRRLAVFATLRQSQPVAVPRQIAALYGLTSREMEITSALVQGQSIKDIAAAANVSEHTVRSQVKSVLTKTRTHRQSELVRLVLTGPGSVIDMSVKQVHAGEKPSKFMLKGPPAPDEPLFIFLPDGRRLAYREYGDPWGKPLIHCHSIMGSRLEVAIDGDAHAKSRGIRLIVPDRPGIGFSDPCEEISFMHWARDLKALADVLRLDCFDLTGYSIGGPYALAAAFSMPERVKRLSLVGVGTRPVRADDYAAMHPFYRFNLRVLTHARPVYRLFSMIMRRGFYGNPENFFKQFGGQLAAGDRPVFEDPQFRQVTEKSIGEGWRQGVTRTVAEIENWIRSSWGFDVAAVKAPVDLWHGGDDCHVPSVLGARLSEHLPQARRFVCPGEGHMMFFSHWPKMLDALLND
ncbi:MAG: alpha/beta fold hydrolase [Nitrospiria bacterium]